MPAICSLSRLALFGFLVTLASQLFAVTPEQIVYRFPSVTNDGTQPAAGLVADSAGNLYGVTSNGGLSNRGIVFELSPPATSGATWSESILHVFGSVANDGWLPQGTLIFDGSGNLYGTTTLGGVGGNGTVFEMSPPATAGGSWTETILYNFPVSGTLGGRPGGKLAFDPAGNLYGTTQVGGTGTNCGAHPGCGTVYRLSPPATTGGAWTHTVLRNFGVSTTDGFFPTFSGVLYRGGTLYGVTQAGGVNGEGIVYALIPSSGKYIEKILHAFAAVEGGGPIGGLTADSANNLYGTTQWGGGNANCQGGCGAIYQLTPPSIPGGAWTETTLYAFTGGFDGATPWAGLWRSAAGVLYGTNSQRFNAKNHTSLSSGSVYRLNPPAVAGGAWTLGVLHQFQPAGGDGSRPFSELILLNHIFYGTTTLGGVSGFEGQGTVFAVGP